MDHDRDGKLGFKPAHPGEYIREDILPALDMTVTTLASHLGVTRATVSDLIHEKRAVSTEMAIRLGRVFKNGARFWLTLQLQFDLWESERTFKDNVIPIKDDGSKKVA